MLHLLAFGFKLTAFSFNIGYCAVCCYKMFIPGILYHVTMCCLETIVSGAHCGILPIYCWILAILVSGLLLARKITLIILFMR